MMKGNKIAVISLLLFAVMVSPVLAINDILVELVAQDNTTITMSDAAALKEIPLLSMK